jgi:archaellum component FlaC
MAVHILLDYRAKNHKQTINEILIGVIAKDKEKRKQERLKLMELMSLDTQEATSADIEILNASQVEAIRDQVYTIEKQVEFQRGVVESIYKKLHNFVGLPDNQRKKKRQPLMFMK